MPTPHDTLLCRYQYDALDRLTGQVSPDTPEQQRFYCKSRLATEIQGALRRSIIQYDDQLLAQQQREGNTLNTTLLSTDKQRSVFHTFEADHPHRPIAYSPYGHRSAASGLLSLLGFNGERPDPVTGHYLLGNGYRAFNPVLMRFNCPDSWSPFGSGGLNSYAYCLGDPTNHSDRSGHSILLALIASRTGEITRKIYFNNGIYRLVKHGIRIEDAWTARNRILEINNTLDITNYQNRTYAHNYHNSQRPMSLKILAGIAAPKNSLNQYPSLKDLSAYVEQQLDQRTLLEFIKDPISNNTHQTTTTFNRRTLNFAALGNGDARIGDRIVNQKTAKNYQQSILRIRQHPNYAELDTERTRLLNDHFSSEAAMI